MYFKFHQLSPPTLNFHQNRLLAGNPPVSRLPPSVAHTWPDTAHTWRAPSVFSFLFPFPFSFFIFRFFFFSFSPLFLCLHPPTLQPFFLERLVSMNSSLQKWRVLGKLN
ncbi:unnamed protein product [Cuscuta epithymum]|uniref:Uncharacterized protein n=1 Tax=Cuscuta epithymum TaxID=186058 RepID=A0AAV0C6E7_9ASTE|nr:unnamed protein product [Cuscuta epithymum]